MQALKQGVARRRPLEDSEINHVRRDVGRIVSRHDAETIRQTVLPNEAFGIAPRSGEHLEPKGLRRIAVLAPAHSTVSATTGITIENFFDVRSTKTFESLGALARALPGYSGKNVFWLSEAFPASILPQRKSWRADILNCLAIFQKYSGALEASQISLYPVDIRGLGNSSLTPMIGSPGYHSPDRQHNDMVGSQLLMRNIAQQTGGEAFYSTNDLKGALRHAMEHGATYYTLGYVPQNGKWNGDFRHIAVKLDRPGMKLDYRQGYYAVRDDPSPADAAYRMLVAQMQPGVPESTMLLLRVKVTPPDDKSGKVSIDYGVYAPDIAFTGDQQKHAKLEFVAVAWDRNNRAAGDVSETMNLDVKPETLQRMLNTGVPAHQELALNPGTYKLRLGVMDYDNNKIGTLEVPVTVTAKEHIASKN